jgi:hypothetical protein
MKITAIRETMVALSAPMRNADIAFDAMTASAVAVFTDRIVDGRPLVGLGFDSIGRYGHGGLLRERFMQVNSREHWLTQLVCYHQQSLDR